MGRYPAAHLPLRPAQPRSHPMTYDPTGPYPPQPPHGQQPASWGQPPPVVSGPPAAPYGVPQQPYQQQPYAPPPPKKTSPLKVILIIAGVVVFSCVGLSVIGALAGGDDKPAASVKGPEASTTAKDVAEKTTAPKAEQPAADEPFDVPVGSTITATSSDGDVIEATLRSVKSVKKGCNSLGVDPKNGLYVIVDVLVVQKSGTGSVNPLDFTFVADDGTSNDALSSVFSGCDEPSLESADLRKGQKRAGKIAFDVNSKAGSLEWAPGGLGADTVGSWKTK